MLVTAKKENLVKLFESSLLSSSYGYDSSSVINKALIKTIIEHKSFVSAFSRFQSVTMEDLALALDNLATKLETYFKNKPLKTQEDYDLWFKLTGEAFLKDCKTSGFTISFGKVQKIINVTMKHLYFYSVSENYFKYCHITLDSMTYSGGNNTKKKGFYLNEVRPNAQTITFSNLTYDQYITIQKEMRSYLEESKHEYKDFITASVLSPFKAEFYIRMKYKK